MENFIRIPELCPANHSYPIKQSVLDKIKEQMNKNLCLIHMKNNATGSGFLCLIPFPDQLNRLPVLITNNHVLKNDDISIGKTINFSIKNIEYSIMIYASRKVYTSEKYDTTIIQILPEKDKLKEFLEIDENNNENDQYYAKKEVYIIQHPQGTESSYSAAKTGGVDEFNIQHFCSTDFGSSGSPVILISNQKVIAVHKERTNRNFNLATLISYPIKEFFEIQKRIPTIEFKNRELNFEKINIIQKQS